MIREQGRIVRVDGQRAWVEASSRLDCPRCQEGKGCGGGLLGRWLGERLHEIEVANPSRLPLGEWVELGFDERRLMVAAGLVYCIPLIVMVLAASIGHLAMNLGEPAVIFLSLAGLALGVVVSRFIAQGSRSAAYFSPTIQKRLSGPPQGCRRWTA